MENKDGTRPGERTSSNGGGSGGRVPGAGINGGADDQRSSFYERAARRIGERGQPPRSEGQREERGRGGPSGQPFGQNFNQGGGFGAGGYGSYGSQGGFRTPPTGYGGAGNTDWGGGGRGGGVGSWGNEGNSWSHQERGGGGQGPGEQQHHQGYVERFDQARGAYHGEERERVPGRRRWQREAITAGEIMTSNLRCVTRETSLQEVAQIMKEENVGVVPVTDERRKLVGMVTDRDLVVRAAADGKSFAQTRADDVMTDDVEAVTPNEELKDLIELMGKKQVRRVPVVDRDDRLLGIISMGDIANRADYDEELQDALERVSSKRSFWSRLWL